MVKIWLTLPEAGEQFSSLLEFVSVWRSWMNWDMLSEAEACYSKYILIKAEVYVER